MDLIEKSTLNNDLPSNSDNVNNIEKKKKEKIVTGEVTTRKKTFGSKVKDLFIGDDISSVKDYVVSEMIVPGIKEAFIGSIEMMLFGNRRSGSRRSSSRNAGSLPYVSYSSYSNNRRDDRRSQERTTAKPYEFEELIFENLAEAEAVLDALIEDINMYNEATLASYYELAGHSGNYTDFKYGWTNLDDVRRPRRIRGGGYVIDLPRPRLLD